MLVDGESLDVAPAADQLLEAVAGELTDEFENGEIAWNNELALHVIELKCNGPRPTLDGLGRGLRRQCPRSRTTSSAARACGSCRRRCIPWMDPNDVKLWPHGTRSIYDTFDRIFSCKGHGWANLAEPANQSAVRRRRGVRAPACSRSLPAADSARSRGELIRRRRRTQRHPRQPARRLSQQLRAHPVDHGRGRAGARSARSANTTSACSSAIYRDLAPHDPEGVLRHEWVNARGAIARFDRMAIEIRVLDVQETPVDGRRVRGADRRGVEVALRRAMARYRERMNRWRTEELGKLLDARGAARRGGRHR